MGNQTNQSLNRTREELSRVARPANNIPADKTGTCVVVSRSTNGSGCVCTVTPMGTSINVEGAICHSAVLAVGTVVQYRQRRGGHFELMSGGGGGASTSSTTDGRQVLPVGYLRGSS